MFNEDANYEILEHANDICRPISRCFSRGDRGFFRKEVIAKLLEKITALLKDPKTEHPITLDQKPYSRLMEAYLWALHNNREGYHSAKDENGEFLEDEKGEPISVISDEYGPYKPGEPTYLRTILDYFIEKAGLKVAIRDLTQVAGTYDIPINKFLELTQQLKLIHYGRLLGSHGLMKTSDRKKAVLHSVLNVIGDKLSPEKKQDILEMTSDRRTLDKIKK